MTLSEFKNQIETIYKASFPNSLISVEYTNNLYSSIFIRCYLAQNKNEVTNGIWQNDVFSILLSIDTEKGELSKNLLDTNHLPDNLRLEASQKYYRVKPKNQYMFCDSQKLSFRKTIGDPNKIIKSFEKFVNNLKDLLTNDFNNNKLLDKDQELVKIKLSL